MVEKKERLQNRYKLSSEIKVKQPQGAKKILKVYKSSKKVTNLATLTVTGAVILLSGILLLFLFGAGAVLGAWLIYWQNVKCLVHTEFSDLQQGVDCGLVLGGVSL